MKNNAKNHRTFSRSGSQKKMTRPYLINQAGWLENEKHCPSPYYDLRPDPQDISLLVIHYISLPLKNLVAAILMRFFREN